MVLYYYYCVYVCMCVCVCVHGASLDLFIGGGPPLRVRVNDGRRLPSARRASRSHSSVGTLREERKKNSYCLFLSFVLPACDYAKFGVGGEGGD